MKEIFKKVTLKKKQLKDKTFRQSINPLMSVYCVKGKRQDIVDMMEHTFQVPTPGEPEMAKIFFFYKVGDEKWTRI